MAFIPLRNMGSIQKLVRSACFTTLMKRPMAYKSSISLDTLYPNSSLKLSTPTFNPDPKEKFSGFIPIEKLEVTYSASSGPGGQNVNKVHTKVDLRFKPSEADWLDSDVRESIVKKYGNKFTKEGYMVFRSETTRSQQLNLADCLQKLRQTIRTAAVTKKEPSAETREMIRQRHLKASRLRIAVKREAALKRAMKQPPTLDL